jgi:hypothetical protein
VYDNWIFSEIAVAGEGKHFNHLSNTETGSCCILIVPHHRADYPSYFTVSKEEFQAECARIENAMFECADQIY